MVSMVSRRCCFDQEEAPCRHPRKGSGQALSTQKAALVECCLIPCPTLCARIENYHGRPHRRSFKHTCRLTVCGNYPSNTASQPTATSRGGILAESGGAHLQYARPWQESPTCEANNEQASVPGHGVSVRQSVPHSETAAPSARPAGGWQESPLGRFWAGGEKVKPTTAGTKLRGNTA